MVFLKAVAVNNMQDTRFMRKLVGIAHSKPQLPLFRTTHLPSFLLVTSLVFPIALPVDAYCQEPRCCADPRGQFPTPNPPC